MSWLAIISFTVLFIYIFVSIIKNKGIPVSLSDTYYMWPKWVFPAIMWATGFTLLPCWLEITAGSSLQFLSFLSCAGFIFVGCAPNFRNDKGEKKIHVIAAYTAAFAAMLSMAFVTGPWWFPFYCLLINLLMFYKDIKTKYIFLLEWSVIQAVFCTVLHLLI